MGYSQELARRLGTFSNFALSFSIICILAGGVTSFHLGFCSVGGASIGLGWPLVVCSRLQSRHDGAARLGVSDGRRPLSLGGAPGRPRLGLGHGLVQPRGARHRAGGDQRRNLPLCAGVYSPGAAPRARLDGSGLGVVLITGSQAAINHLGIGVTARLTDFSGYWILLVAAVLQRVCLPFARD